MTPCSLRKRTKCGVFFLIICTAAVYIGSYKIECADFRYILCIIYTIEGMICAFYQHGDDCVCVCVRACFNI